MPVQVHGMDADPLLCRRGRIDAARELVESTDQAELFVYPGDQHLFADAGLPSYDADAAATLKERVLGSSTLSEVPDHVIPAGAP